MVSRHVMPTHHPRIFGVRHMAASAHYLGAQAALEMLDAGGNAVDAGVAGGIALQIVQGEFLNFAGVAPIVLRMADGETVSISGLGSWPQAASIDYFNAHHGGRIPTGIMRTVVPGAPDAWITALERYGTMAFGDVAKAAVRYARTGYAAQSITEEVVRDHRHLIEAWPENEAVYLPGGRVPEPGQILRQPEAAASLDYMADEERVASASGGRLAGLEAARAAFYRGDIAEKIVRYHEENGGWMTRDDLSSFRVEVETAPRIIWRGAEVYGCGPWCQGPVLLQTLKLLEAFELPEHNSARYVHLLTEALKLAFADRHAYYGDPRFIDVPLQELLSESYAAQRRGLLRWDAAHPGMPEPGVTSVVPGATRHAATPEWRDPGIDTSYICVVDRHGNAFSATPSDDVLNGPMIPSTGFVPSTRGMQSWLDPAHPACLAPGKRPRLTPSPALIVKPGEWVMPMGSPGNDVQPQAMLQVLLNSIVFKMSPQEAIDQPRFATYSFPATTDPHDFSPGRLALEDRFDEETCLVLSALGHDVVRWPGWEWRAGSVCLVWGDLRTGLLEGGADTRRPGGVRGW